MGSYFGVEVLLHARAVVLTLSIVLWASPLSPLDIPGFFGVSPALFIALTAPVMLGSIFMHEAAHAIAGRAVGIPIRSIVIDLDRGHTTPGRGTESPWADIAFVAAGPLVNVAAWLAMALDERWSGPGHEYLGFPIFFNQLLAANLLPIMPLDGGKVWRGVLWACMGDRVRAERAAGWSGRLLTTAGLLVVAAVTAVKIGPAAGGAVAVGAMMLLRSPGGSGEIEIERIHELTIADVMVPGIRVEAGALAQTVVQDQIRRRHSADPRDVESLDRPYVALDPEGAVLGMLTSQRVRELSSRTLDWTTATFGDVMQPIEQLLTVEPAMQAFTALVYMSERRVDTLIAVENGQAAGCVTAAALTRALRREERGWNPEPIAAAEANRP